MICCQSLMNRNIYKVCVRVYIMENKNCDICRQKIDLELDYHLDDLDVCESCWESKQ